MRTVGFAVVTRKRNPLYDPRYPGVPGNTPFKEVYSMPRLPRHAKKIARELLLREFENTTLPNLLAIVAQLTLGRTSQRWGSHSVAIDVSVCRSAVELAMQMPSVAVDRRPKEERELERAEKELRNWKRRRTVARQKVAKYSRMVRYRRKGVAG